MADNIDFSGHALSGEVNTFMFDTCTSSSITIDIVLFLAVLLVMYRVREKCYPSLNVISSLRFIYSCKMFTPLERK